MLNEILTISAEKVKPIISQLSREYKLDKELIQLVGGGGGATALVPFTALHLKFPHKIAKDCEVVSAIGAALGMIRDSIEKTIINPTENDIISLRRQAFDSVAAMGAVPESIEVTVEIDSKNKKVIAVAMGSSEMRSRDVAVQELKENEIIKIAATSMRTKEDIIAVSGRTSFFYALTSKQTKKHLFGLLKEETQKLRVIDKEGTIKLQLNNVLCESVTVQSVQSKIKEMIGTLTTFGDAGALIPDIFLLISSKIVDLTGLINETQIMALVDFELENIPQSENIIVIASPKK